jgi:transposase-like protein
MRRTSRRGKKGVPHTDPDDPPRRRGNKQKGHGTFAGDRPPVLGIVGRDTGRLRLEVVMNSTRDVLLPRVLACAPVGTTVYTDEWAAYARIPEYARPHGTVCHNKQRPGGPEYARDDDGDGVREVHCNTLEGIWTGLRNFLRPFRGVGKRYLDRYVAMFEWMHNAKAVTAEFIRAMLVPQRKHRIGT